MAIARLGYLGLSAQDPAAWGPFGTDLLGLMSVAGDGEGVFLKMDDHPFRLMVEKGDEDKLACAGWEVDDAAAYEETVAALEASGATVTRGDEAGAKRRCVTEFCVSADPAGNPIEIYHGRTNVGETFESPQGVSRFLTGDMGLGHVVVPAPNQDETHTFYRDVLGFGDSDDLTLPPPAEGAPEMRIVFMHAANPRHHSLALFNFPVPTGVVHLMFEVPTIDEVGACLDRVTAAGVPLMATLGRHCNDNMLSFYAIGPGGIAVEYGCDGLQLDWETFEPTKSIVADIWGHEYQPVEV
jgi:3,4-dihydroxy-9,10-secoandrosta-1,3,5(10)-triene-9,17-dione 4,5-dioxygenase